MTTKTKIIWRLANRPTSEEIVELLTAGILTKEEAREILFNLETEEDRDSKSLQTEIEFLRKLVEKLSTNKQVIVETIREVHKPYYQQPWYQPYTTWCTATADSGNASYTVSNNAMSTGLLSTSGDGTMLYNAQTQPVSAGFTEIKTF
jgi:asparagine synthetase B (glutamine-hydrolysing)